MAADLRNHITACLLLLLLLGGCRQKLQNPEESDLIYQDIRQELSFSRSALDKAEKDLSATKSSLADLPTATGDRDDALDELSDQNARVEHLKERILFLTQRLEDRKQQCIKEYNDAFEKNLPWPNRQEYDNYIVNKELKNAPKIWSAERRVHQYEDSKRPKEAPTNNE